MRVLGLSWGTVVTAEPWIYGRKGKIIELESENSVVYVGFGGKENVCCLYFFVSLFVVFVICLFIIYVFVCVFVSLFVCLLVYLWV